MKSLIIRRPGHGGGGLADMPAGQGGGSSVPAESLERLLAGRGHRVLAVEYDDARPATAGHRIFQTIEEADPDMVWTVDLAGFSMKTDTGDIAYINLTCPNIHLIGSRGMPSLASTGDHACKGGAGASAALDCLAGKLSIAMFFYCGDGRVYEYLQKSCPEIPYLKLVDDWEGAVEDVMEELGVG